MGGAVPTPLPLAPRLHGRLILAPLTRGGNLPFRKLCSTLNCKVMVGEMAYAKKLPRSSSLPSSSPPSSSSSSSIRRHSGGELVLLRRGSCPELNEAVVGGQIATKIIQEGVNASQWALEEGLDFLDINCGCPIWEVATRRGLGAALLRKPRKLERLLTGIVEASPLPITAKVRTSPLGDKEDNIVEISKAVESAGCAVLTIHGRTTRQRYTKAADWEKIAAIADSLSIPVVGNGDILTLFDARRRLDEYPVHAVMTGRGALIKPWLFREFEENEEWLPTAEQRVDVYYTFCELMREHFGADEKGKKKAFYFLPWHFGFFCRYRPFPSAEYESRSRDYPLLQTRFEHEDLERLPKLERVLRCLHEEAHQAMAEVLWHAASSAAASEALEELYPSVLEWDAKEKGSGSPSFASEGRG